MPPGRKAIETGACMTTICAVLLLCRACCWLPSLVCLQSGAYCFAQTASACIPAMVATERCTQPTLAVAVAVAAKLQSASQERSQTAVRHHGSTRHVAYASLRFD